ncbi:hypothetical protein ABSL23_02275 [Halobacterium sp. NMX12-1]|uniref:Uncharacterized protein n=1 Tax=Halobacterium sp. NMX12-1 TaxID=3166650 RepID=A0AAU8CF17_9EURY
MPDLVPEPKVSDRPFCEPTSVLLGSNTEATLRFEPVQNNAEFRIGTVAMSKRPESEYVVRMDDETVYGPAPIPPTDIDDLQVTFIPARAFEQSLELTVRNLQNTTGQRRYSIQPLGYEVMS